MAAWTVACMVWLAGAVPSSAAPAALAAATDSGPAAAVLRVLANVPSSALSRALSPALSLSPSPAVSPALSPALATVQQLQGLGGLPIRRLPALFPEPPGRAEEEEEDEKEDGEEKEQDGGAATGGLGDDRDGRGGTPSSSTAEPGADDPRAGDGSVLRLEPPLDRFAVRIVSPEPGQTVSGRVSVAAEVRADRPAAVRAVDFIVDGRMLFSDAESPYELLWDSGEPAPHRIEVQAWGPGRQMVHDVLETGAAGRTAGSDAAYSARVERVEIHVRVEGVEPGAVPAGPASFRVLEEGRPQRVLAVERVSDLPVAVGMVVDHSGSMVERLEQALEAGAEFVEGLITHPDDKAFVMAFSDVPMLLQGFTNDVGRLRGSFSLIERGRYTALYDAIAAAARRFTGVEGRRAVVVLTDGADQASELDLREAVAAAQRADVAVYPVAVEVGPRFFREQWVLRRIAEQTGGRFFGLARRDDPAGIYEAIAEDLRSQYRITYAPARPGGSGEWRSVVVELAGDVEDEDVEIRARPGYYAR